MPDPGTIADLIAHPELYALELILGALTALTLLAVIGSCLWIACLTRRLDASTRRLEDLNQVVSAYGQTLISLKGTFERIEERVTEFSRRNLEIQSQFASNRSFEEASRMVRDGQPARSLVTACGLSDAEADLMVRIHRQAEPPPRQHLQQAPAPPLAERADPQGAVPSDGEIRLREALKRAHSR